MVRTIAFCFLLVIVSVITFYPCLNNDFVNWDDDVYVFENSDIQGLSWNNVGKIFSHFYGGAYVPLTMFSFIIDHQIGGLEPFVYHRTNLILHIINTLLIFWFVYVICKKMSLSFLTALLFAIHPLHVEPVAWVTGRKDLLYALFYIGSLIAYVYFKSKNSNSYYILSFLLFVMALFSKPVAVTLPLVILILEYFLFNQRGRKSLLLMIPYLILSVIFFYIAVLAQKSAGAFPHGQLSFLQRINISCSNFLFYLYKMIVPTKLACIYPIQNYWYAILVVIAIVIVVFISLKYSRIFALIMMLFVITMLPVLQLVPVGQVLSDRYTYISLTCFFFLFAGVVHTLYFRAKKILRILVITVVLCVSVLFSFLSRSQCLIWRDGMTLWTYVINTYPDISVAYNNRGTLYGNEKNYESALKDYDRALQINPKYVKAYVHRGNTYNVLGDFDRALKDYDTALEIDSTYLDAYHNRAVLYFNAKEYELALKDLLKIRELGGHVPDEVIKYVKSLSEKKN